MEENPGIFISITFSLSQNDGTPGQSGPESNQGNHIAVPNAPRSKSLVQGDDWCKGCGRSFDEVQFWPAMGPAEKRAVWRRITQEHTAWRFNRYAERAAEGRTGAAPGAIGAAATSS